MVELDVMPPLRAIRDLSALGGGDGPGRRDSKTPKAEWDGGRERVCVCQLCEKASRLVK